jgi:hypothetical protein
MDHHHRGKNVVQPVGKVDEKSSRIIFALLRLKRCDAGRLEITAR